MITAVDTNVLLDVFTDEPSFRKSSLAALRRCVAEGQLIACDVVWAEVIAAFGSEKSALRALHDVPVTYSTPSEETALRAGAAWRAYRTRGGTRERLVADFIVGAHAMEQADRLLTRDRGFQKAAFADLAIIDPSR